MLSSPEGFASSSVIEDVNQLPSVGPGNVLKDMIASEQFNVVKLTHIFRQAAESDIIVNAHKINEGERVDLAKRSRDFLFIRRETPDAIISAMLTLITQKLFQGISYLLSKGMTYSDFPEPIMSISGMKGSTMPAGHIIMILSILFLEGMFCFTILGKNILSMGYDEQVLRQNGIPVGKYKLSAYILGSFFFAVAALLLISRQGLAVSNMGNGLEVDGMFAVCIAGGASLILKNSEVKRRVPISNFYLGILVIAVIENGMQLSGSIQYYQYVITSVVVLYSVIPTLPAFLPKNQEKKQKN